MGGTMPFNKLIAPLAIALSATCSAQADESAVVLGKSAYGTYCAVCHGQDAKGDGELAALFEVKPTNLTKLSQRSDGDFPFADVYEVIVLGKEAPGHGTSEMPVWGDYFMADALEDRGMHKSDAMFVAAGRALSLAYYLETIQE